MSAVHLAGVQGLAAGLPDLELRISSAGVQIYRLDLHQTAGTLAWSEIRAVRLPRRLALRRRPPRLEVRTTGGRALFALPGLRAGQVRQHLSPLLAREGVRTV
jgi:predicted component of type VI protein secretion system